MTTLAPPTLVLLPGMDGSGLLFEPFMAALAERSPLPVQVMRYPRDHALGYAALVAHVTNALPDSGRVVLLGESFSGPIAAMVAAQQAERVAGVILCCSFVRAPSAALWPLAPVLAHVAAAPALLPLAAAMLFGRWTSPTWRQRLQQALAGISVATWRARLQAVATVDASAAFAALRMPVAYLQATRDRLIGAATADALRRIHPALAVSRIEGPHALLQARPSECAAVVHALIDGPMRAPSESRADLHGAAEA